MVFCCCSSSFSRLDVCSVQRRSSARFGCNGWIFRLLSDLPVSSKQLAQSPLTSDTLGLNFIVPVISAHNEVSVCVLQMGFPLVAPQWECLSLYGKDSESFFFLGTANQKKGLLQTRTGWIGWTEVLQSIR